MQWCGSGAAPGGYSAPIPDEDCEDCVETRIHYRTVTIPCTRNKYSTVQTRVPREVSRRVAKQVPFTDFEMRSKQEPYTVMRAETRYKNETQTYQVPVKKTDTIMVPVTRKVPKTIYVDQIFQEKREVQKTIMEPRQRTITVPHTVQVPETKYRAVNFKVPVQRFRTEYDTVTQTVYDTVARQVCTPVTTQVTKRIPVTTVHARVPAPCPPGGCPPDDLPGGVTNAQAIVNEHAAMDKNGDGVVDAEEALAYRGYTTTRTGGPVYAGGASFGGYPAGGYTTGGYTTGGYTTGGYTTGGYSNGGGYTVAPGGGRYAVAPGYTYGTRASYGSAAAPAAAAAAGSASGADDKNRGNSFGGFEEPKAADKNAKK